MALPLKLLVVAALLAAPARAAPPLASATVTVSATPTLILTATIASDGFLILRNNGPHAGTVEIAFSADGGRHWQIIAEPTLADPALFGPGAAPSPYPLPSRLERGDLVRVRGTAQTGTTSITCELYRRTALGRENRH